MLLLIFISIGIISVLLVNEFYFKIVCRLQQEQHILRGRHGRYDMLSFGSAYCRHAISSLDGIDCYNFGFVSQFFFYTNKMLREYAPRCLRSGGVVYLIIADLVFARVGEGMYGAERYPLILSRRSLGAEYSIKNYLRLRFPIFICPKVVLSQTMHFCLDGEKSTDYYRFYMTEHNPSTFEESLAAAQRRCSSWCRQFGMKDTISGDIPYELDNNFSQTRPILTGMIDFCIQQGYRPVLVVTPVSGVMNELIGDMFIKNVLIDNIYKSNIQHVPFLNYLRDERFKDLDLYSKDNPDFLNARGRRLFTEVLVADTKNILQDETRNINISSK